MRSCNIVVYGLDETKEVEAEKWREGETKKVMDLVDGIGVQVEGEIAVKFRAGKRREEGEKPRPLIVRVTDDETRAKIFRNARRLSQGATTKRVFISQDLTWNQREADKKAEVTLKEEAARKTEESKNGGRRVRFLVVGAGGSRRIVERQEVVTTAE